MMEQQNHSSASYSTYDSLIVLKMDDADFYIEDQQSRNYVFIGKEDMDDTYNIYIHGKVFIYIYEGSLLHISLTYFILLLYY